MSDMSLNVVVRADARGLIGQMEVAEQSVRNLKTEVGQAAGASTGLATQTRALGAAEAAAAVETNAHAAAQARATAAMGAGAAASARHAAATAASGAASGAAASALNTLTDRSGRAGAGLDDLGGSATETGAGLLGLRAIVAGMSTTALAATGGIAAFVLALGGALAAGLSYEEHLEALDAALLRSGQSARFQAEDIMQAANIAAAASGEAYGEIESALLDLAASGDFTLEGLQRIGAVGADIAKELGLSVEDGLALAADAFRALAQGDVEELTEALRFLGDDADDTARRLVGMGNDAEAQAALLDTLAQAADGGDGSLTSAIGNLTGAIVEWVGEMISSTGVIETLRDWIAGLAEDANMAATAIRQMIAARNSDGTSGQLGIGSSTEGGVGAGVRNGPGGDGGLLTTAQAARRPARRSRGGGRPRRPARQRAQRDPADRWEDQIERLQDSFSDMPREIIRVENALEQVDELLAAIGNRQGPRFDRMRADLAALRPEIASSLLRPFQEMVAEASRQRDIQLLILAGREREVEVLGRVEQLQREAGAVLPEQRAEIERIVAEEERINDLLEQRDAIIGAYRSSIGELRGALTDLLSGGSVREFGRSLLNNARNLRGQLATERLFGEGLRALERQIDRTGIGAATTELAQTTRRNAKSVSDAGNAADRFAAILLRAGDKIQNASAVPGTVATAGIGEARPKSADEDIVVTAPARRRVLDLAADDYFNAMARVVTSPLTRILDQLGEDLNSALPRQIGNVLTAGVAGYLQGGPVVGALGALNGLGIGGDVGAVISRAFDGSKTGASIAQFGKALGLKTSTTGGAIGGALGGATGIPGGDIIGSIIGSIVGGLFKKAKTGTATITSVDGEATLGGNNRSAKDQASGLAGSVQGTIARIAEALGGQTGAFAVSLGIRDGNIFVDPTGAGKTKKKQGAISFGKDEAGAVMAAVANAIADGGIAGVSAAVQKALASSKDVEKAVAEALKVREVEELLGGLGGTLERAFKAFQAQAAERVRIATQYGFDVVAIEQRNAEDLAALQEQLLSDRVGALKALLSDLSFGDLFEGSAADRRQRLLVEAANARRDADAGKDGAAQRLADIMRQLVETSRDAFGTAGEEYAADRQSAISAAEAVIAQENERIRVAQETAAGTRAAVEQSNTLLNEGNDLLAGIQAMIDDMRSLLANSGGVPAAMVLDISRQAQL